MEQGPRVEIKFGGDKGVVVPVLRRRGKRIVLMWWRNLSCRCRIRLKLNESIRAVVVIVVAVEVEADVGCG
jgi:hypothetical protein